MLLYCYLGTIWNPPVITVFVLLIVLVNIGCVVLLTTVLIGIVLIGVVFNGIILYCVLAVLAVLY